jgi:hypothetical protein
MAVTFCCKRALFNLFSPVGLTNAYYTLSCRQDYVLLVRVGKNLSEMFPIRNGLKQGDALSTLLFNLALEYAIKRV